MYDIELDLMQRIVSLVEKMIHDGHCYVTSTGALTFAPESRHVYAKYYGLIEWLKAEHPSQYAKLKDTYKRLFSEVV